MDDFIKTPRCGSLKGKLEWSGAVSENKLLAHFPHSWKLRRKLSQIVFSEVVPAIVRRLLTEFPLSQRAGQLLKNTPGVGGGRGGGQTWGRTRLLEGRRATRLPSSTRLWLSHCFLPSSRCEVAIAQRCQPGLLQRWIWCKLSLDALVDDTYCCSTCSFLILFQLVEYD